MADSMRPIQEALDTEEIPSLLKEQLGLTPFSASMAAHYLQPRHADDTPDESCRSDMKSTPAVATTVPHVVAWLLELKDMAERKGRHTASVLHPPNSWQRGCPELIPGLTSRNIWVGHGTLPDISVLLPAIKVLESAYPDIRRECLALRDADSGVFQQYRAPTYKEGAVDSVGGTSTGRGYMTGVDAGNWNVCYLNLHDVDCKDATARCPQTMTALSALPREYGHALFSVMSGGTHITTHTGPTNKKLRIQLPLYVPEPGRARLRVGPDTIELQEGKCIIFDDSYQHEAWNDGGALRYVLICDIWHPDLLDPEVKFLGFVRNCQLRAAKALSSAAGSALQQDFYNVLRTAKAGDRDEEDEVASIPVRAD